MVPIPREPKKPTDFDTRMKGLINADFKNKLLEGGINKDIVDNLNDDWAFDITADIGILLMKIVFASDEQRREYGSLNKLWAHDDNIVEVNHIGKIYSTSLENTKVTFLSGIKLKIPTMYLTSHGKFITELRKIYATEVLDRI